MPWGDTKLMGRHSFYFCIIVSTEINLSLLLPHFSRHHSSFRKGKHSSIAKNHLDEIVGFFSKIDPVLGNLVAESKPGPGDTTSDSASKKSSSSGKKRRNSGKESPDAPSPKKSASEVITNGMTLSQREKRAMNMLADHIVKCGGTLQVSLLTKFVGYQVSSES